MAAVTKASVSVSQDGVVSAVICYHVTPGVPNTANARTAHASALRDGMDDTVHCVSLLLYIGHQGT